MIRLGSLGGYPFKGPRVLGGWHPPQAPGMFAILARPDPSRNVSRSSTSATPKTYGRGVSLSTTRRRPLDRSGRWEMEPLDRLL